MPTPQIVWQCPLRGAVRVTQHFGDNDVSGYAPMPGHNGIDYSDVEGRVVRAPCAGEVAVGNPAGAYSAYGVHLWIKGSHEGKTFWAILAYLRRALADDHEMVEPGNIVALSGNTGRSTAPHLHVGIETTTPNPGYQDAYDPDYYWHAPTATNGRVRLA